MADSRQFGSPRMIRQFGYKLAADQSGDGGHCAQCEAMVADALDGTLTPADQQLFEAHTAECVPCGQMLADARRGVAFLEMLRHPKPEPPTGLLDRILAQTSGQSSLHASVQTGEAEAGHPVPAAIGAGFPTAAVPQPVVAVAPDYIVPTAGYGFGNVIPFPARVTARMRAGSFGQVAFQPRLIMTAAMAFFSIALTMDLTGVRLRDFRTSNLTPTSLRRDFYSADARVVQYYEGLRVVYELESRVHDIESVSDNATTGNSGQSASPNSQGSPSQPTSQPAGQPGSQAPAAQPSQPNPDTQSGRKQRSPAAGPTSGPAALGPAFRPAPSIGSGNGIHASRREVFGRGVSLAGLTAAEIASGNLQSDSMNLGSEQREGGLA